MAQKLSHFILHPADNKGRVLTTNSTTPQENWQANEPMDPRTVEETAPLLGAEVITTDPRTIEEREFAKGDPENPLEWPLKFKWLFISILFFMGATVTFTCISPVPIAGRIVQDLSNGEKNKYASVLLVTIWELGEAAGPLLIAPLSETFGRYPVLNVCSVFFTAAAVLAATAQTTPQFILSRVLSGLFVTSNVLGPAIVGDIFEPDMRGSAMSFVMLAPNIGGAVGPAIGGYVADALSWRWVVWMSVLLCATCQILVLLCFRETYGPTILARKVLRLRKLSGSASAESAAQNNSKSRGAEAALESIIRPFLIFKSSIVLVAISLFGSLTFSHYFNMTTTLPDILEDVYGLKSSQTGMSMLSFSIGSFIGLFICNRSVDRIYVHLTKANGGVGQPEYRLPLMILAAVLAPFGLLLYGWSAEFGLPLWVFLFSFSSMGMILLMAFLPLSAYVVDAFGPYAASAMTGLIVLRCLMGSLLPLSTTPLVENYGFGRAFSVISLVSAALAPIPVVIMIYGQKLRQLSKYTRNDAAE
ncbi:unnamed protein product [Clonostachys rhizophaga]|uniref:Major facilitator superfamily (MFS) profile domain-containing protein n=1 Tax=Clonostachys rhizophaga TaxID=160324 RepID=A0A9N9YNZ7_9HYPO|nr:unnamed protein product [Clonostachys rhizophaga]